jgi:hypothetical protein
VVRGHNTLWSVQLLVAVGARDRPALDARTRAASTLFARWQAELRTLCFEQRAGWTAMRPAATGQATPGPRRLIDTSALAASVPHPVGDPRPVPGVLTGIDPRSGCPLLTDRFGLHNPNRLVVGTSGAGKSYAAKLEVLRSLVGQQRVVVVDPEGEFGPLADLTGGLTLTVGEEPAGLDPVGLATRPRLASAEGVAMLTSWATALLGAPLSSVDVALLDRSLTVLRSDHAGSAATVSELLDVVADLANYPPFAGSDLPARLAPAAAGSLADIFAPNPDLADPPPLVVFDLRSVTARIRPAVMACVLAWAWTATIAASSSERPEASTSTRANRLVVIDEAHLLLDDPPAASLLAQFARRARKYQVGLDVVTQRLSDFLDHPAGEAVLANTASKLLLGCENHERAAVSAGLGLTAAETALLTPGHAGQGLLITPTHRGPIRIVAHPAEHALAATGPRR